jgi:hypothetical protein
MCLVVRDRNSSNNITVYSTSDGGDIDLRSFLREHVYRLNYGHIPIPTYLNSEH